MDFRNYIPLMVAMLGVASGRVVRSFEIQVSKGTNGQKKGSAKESTNVQENNMQQHATNDKQILCVVG